MLVVFVLDTSASMNQKVANGLSLLDCAKSAIEHFHKVRQRDSNYRMDRYMLVTCEDGPGAIKAMDKYPFTQFLKVLKGVHARDLTSIGTAVQRTFDFLHLQRLAGGVDNFGQGRNPCSIDPTTIILLTDGTELTSLGGAGNCLTLPGLVSVGHELCQQPFRWDQRFYATVLRIPSVSPSVLERSGATAVSGPVSGTHQCAMAMDTSIAAFCDVTGGKCVMVVSWKFLMQHIEFLASRLQPCVLVSFENIPVPGQNLPFSNGGCQRKALVLRGSQGQSQGHWPIPEAFWLDGLMQTLPPRDPHPTISYRAVDHYPYIPSNFVVDKYEVEANPIVGYLMKQQAGVCWQVFARNSRGPSAGYGDPFGYLRLNHSGNTLTLYVLPYNYPALWQLLDQLAKLPAQAKVAPPLPWRRDFDRYCSSIPPYYVAPLRGALKRWGLNCHVIPDNLEAPLVNGFVGTQLKRLRTQAKVEADREIMRIQGEQHIGATNVGSSVSPHRGCTPQFFQACHPSTPVASEPHPVPPPSPPSSLSSPSSLSVRDQLFSRSTLLPSFPPPLPPPFPPPQANHSSHPGRNSAMPPPSSGPSPGIPAPPPGTSFLAPPPLVPAGMPGGALGGGEALGGVRELVESLVMRGPSPRGGGHSLPVFNAGLGLGAGAESAAVALARDAGAMRDVAIFRNPFDIPREQLLRQLLLLQVRVAMAGEAKKGNRAEGEGGGGGGGGGGGSNSSSSVGAHTGIVAVASRLLAQQEEEAKHSVPIEKMGDFNEALMRQQTLRDPYMDDQDRMKRQRSMFGNPYRQERSDAGGGGGGGPGADEAWLDGTNGSASGGRKRRRQRTTVDSTRQDSHHAHQIQQQKQLLQQLQQQQQHQQQQQQSPQQQQQHQQQLQKLTPQPLPPLQDRTEQQQQQRQQQQQQQQLLQPLSPLPLGVLGPLAPPAPPPSATTPIFPFAVKAQLGRPSADGGGAVLVLSPPVYSLGRVNAGPHQGDSAGEQAREGGGAGRDEGGKGRGGRGGGAEGGVDEGRRGEWIAGVAAPNERGAAVDGLGGGLGMAREARVRGLERLGSGSGALAAVEDGEVEGDGNVGSLGGGGLVLVGGRDVGAAVVGGAERGREGVKGDGGREGMAPGFGEGGRQNGASVSGRGHDQICVTSFASGGAQGRRDVGRMQGDSDEAARRRGGGEREGEEEQGVGRTWPGEEGWDGERPELSTRKAVSEFLLTAFRALRASRGSESPQLFRLLSMPEFPVDKASFVRQLVRQAQRSNKLLLAERLSSHLKDGQVVGL